MVIFKWPICRWFADLEWLFSMAMLKCQRKWYCGWKSVYPCLSRYNPIIYSVQCFIATSSCLLVQDFVHPQYVFTVRNILLIIDGMIILMYINNIYVYIHVYIYIYIIDIAYNGKLANCNWAVSVLPMGCWQQIWLSFPQLAWGGLTAWRIPPW